MKSLLRRILGSAAMRRISAAVGILGVLPEGLGVFFNFFLAFWSCLVVGIYYTLGKYLNLSKMWVTTLKL